MTDRTAPLGDYDRPRYPERVAAEKINPTRPPSLSTMRAYRKRGLLGFARVFGMVLYSDRHIDEFLSRCDARARRAVTR